MCQRVGTRNVPALQNLIWKDDFMWDGSIRQLEKQAINPITNPHEMGESMEHVRQKLQHSPKYKMAFQATFQDTTITNENMLKALTQFTSLLISTNPRYDQFVQQELDLTESEKNAQQQPVDSRLKNIGSLSDTDKTDLIAVLKTLTDKGFLYDRRFNLEGK